MILTTRPATRDEAVLMGLNLRRDDEREVETATGQPASKVVPLSFDVSSECYTFRLTSEGKVERNPVLIFGVADYPNVPDMGLIWMLATSAIARAPMSIMREAAPWLDHFNRRYPAGLTNVVDVRNDLHIRWLTLTGFELGDIIKINGHDFRHAMRFNKDN